MTKDVKTIEGTKTLAEGIRIMRDDNIGSIVVVEGEDHRPVGIFTERDLVKKMADMSHEILGLRMSQVMTRPLTTISPNATVWDGLTLMGRHDVRRLPVIESGKLIGIMTERDALRIILANQNLLLESVSESLPAATREQLKGIAGRFGLEKPPGRASDGEP